MALEQIAARTKCPRLLEAAVSASGFSFEEAWNPKDDLSEIMKDLGLLGGDE